MKMEAEFTGMLPPPRNSWSHQKRAGALEDSLLERQSMALPTSISDFWLLKTTRDYISVVLSHRECDDLPQQPSETNTDGQKFPVAGSSLWQEVRMFCWVPPLVGLSIRCGSVTLSFPGQQRKQPLKESQAC